MSKYKHARVAWQAGLSTVVFLSLLFWVSLPVLAQQANSLTFREFCAVLPDAKDARAGAQIRDQKSHYCSKNYEAAGGADIYLFHSPEEAREWVVTPVTGVAPAIAGQYRPTSSYGDGTGLQMWQTHAGKPLAEFNVSFAYGCFAVNVRASSAATSERFQKLASQIDQKLKTMSRCPGVAASRDASELFTTGGLSPWALGGALVVLGVVSALVLGSILRGGSADKRAAGSLAATGPQFTDGSGALPDVRTPSWSTGQEVSPASAGAGLPDHAGRSADSDDRSALAQSGASSEPAVIDQDGAGDAPQSLEDAAVTGSTVFAGPGNLPDLSESPEAYHTGTTFTTGGTAGSDDLDDLLPPMEPAALSSPGQPEDDDIPDAAPLTSSTARDAAGWRGDEPMGLDTAPDHREAGTKPGQPGAPRHLTAAEAGLRNQLRDLIRAAAGAERPETSMELLTLIRNHSQVDNDGVPHGNLDALDRIVRSALTRPPGASGEPLPRPRTRPTTVPEAD